MSVIITEACVICGACLWECPLEAISPGKKGPVVNASTCTECYGFFGESQCIVVCPVGAIVVDPEPVETLAERVTRIHPEHQPQNAWIWRRIGSVRGALPEFQLPSHPVEPSAVPDCSGSVRFQSSASHQPQ